jgi:molybdopterin-guanine dinucleotide biosynthesis protein A
MNVRSDILGAVLAGGKSSRMGTEKALLPVDGRPMIRHAVDTLAALFSEVIIAGGTEGMFGFLQIDVVPDIVQDCGPLAGIHTALRRAKGRPVFVLSCDTPFVPRALVEHILAIRSEAPTKIASFENVLQPLCGLYDATSLPAIEEDLRAGKYAIFKTLAKIDHAEISITPDLPFFTAQIFWNVNRPQDYHTLPDNPTGTTHG